MAMNFFAPAIEVGAGGLWQFRLALTRLEMPPQNLADIRSGLANAKRLGVRQSSGALQERLPDNQSVSMLILTAMVKPLYCHVLLRGAGAIDSSAGLFS